MEDSFIELVAKMREAQKGYFRTSRNNPERKQQYMKDSRHYENRVDKFLEHKLGSDQQKLF